MSRGKQSSEGSQVPACLKDSDDTAETRRAEASASLHNEDTKVLQRDWKGGVKWSKSRGATLGWTWRDLQSDTYTLSLGAVTDK